MPQDLIVTLAHDEIGIARHVLERSSVLSDIDMIYIIRSKQAAHWQSLARRRNLSPAIIDGLVATNDVSTACVLVTNDNIHIQKGAMKHIARLAITAEDLQQPLLRRPEVDADIAADLYMAVSQALREKLQEKFGELDYSIGRAIDLLGREFGAAALGKHDVTAEMTTLAARFAEKDMINGDMLVKTLRRSQCGFFVALVAAWAHMDVRHVHDIVTQEGGKALAVLMRHLGLLKSEFAPVFLLSRSLRHTEDTVINHEELTLALRTFDGITPADAARIVKSLIKQT